eukprot:CAMPEP_0114626730 /NCGR_PEP_ID=MMETSP0168-20121206/11935_1 /TAXON_ID=95228 ORGANISM="Vannella sp., Strain DIVA3 517/6/12" /NCGR_SAMPLE_ID=MMETSP0168 /ASSEMBLY_ACC=CAM_ASM_000044 /LENGTH=350 /DNA_ID=CAMNT_0001838049 /DNA_START=158 /DNA_END=1207 /DNA_ORIENTATION=+
MLLLYLDFSIAAYQGESPAHVAPDTNRRAFEDGRMDDWEGVASDVDLSVAVDRCPTDSGVGCLQGPVILLHMGRCGSSVLLNMLGWKGQNIGQLQDGDLFFPSLPTPEVFRSLAEWPPRSSMTKDDLYEEGHRATEEEMAFHVKQLKEIFTRASKKLPGGGEAYPIMSLKLYQVENAKMRMDDYLWALAEAGAKHLVVLHRSYLRVFISNKLTKETGKFVNSNKKAQVHCPKEPIVDDWDLRLKNWKRQDLEYRQALTHPAFPHRLAISYETDIYEDPHVGARMVNQFLGRQHRDLALDMYRTSDCPVRDAIAGFHEVERRLKGTTLEYMLEPSGKQVPLPPVEVTVGLR